MSVQLIVYPQNYNGFYNVISSSPTEFIVNGINFYNLNNSPSYTTTLNPPYGAALFNAPPSISNTWYRFKMNNGGSPSYPSVSGGKLILNSVAGSGSISGVYQKLSNLTIGAQYTITINFAGLVSGSIVTQYATGFSIYGTGTATIAASFTDTFTAQSTSDTVMVAYTNTIDNDISITDISIQPVIGAIPSGAIQLIEDGQVICDLYEDEDIPLSLSVDDFKNVAEKVQSYSKAFNLPATKRNNRIFDNIFEITRSYDGVIFNPYKKTKCVLKQDGFILFEGYLRMLDVTDKEGETSYNVNLYSEVVALADVLGDGAFRDLDFTELAHEYNRTEIVNSWNDSGTGITYTNPSTSGFRNAFSTVKYPFVDWNHQYTVDATSGEPVLRNLESSFRPFINIKYLIDRIFQATPFTYESSFFNTADFKKLFMDFNWGGNGFPTPNNTFAASWVFGTGATSNVGTGAYKAFRLLPETSVGGVAGSTLPPNYNTSTYIITATTTNEMYNVSYNFKLENTTIVPASAQCRWIHKIGGVAQPDIDYAVRFMTGAGQFLPYSGSFDIVLNTGDTLEAQFFTANAFVQQSEIPAFSSSAVFVQSSSFVNTAGLLTLREEIGQWDFLKGLITMFNLVTLPDEDNPNNIKIEPYSDVFIPTATAGNTLANRGIEHDWTEKIDVSEMKLTPLTDLNRKTIFKFVEDDDDYSFNQYKNLVGGHLYGSKKFNAGNEFNILFGEDEIVAEPFAATVVKPLMSQFPSFITPAVYSMNDDGTSDSFDNSPRIMYNNGVKPTGVDYYIPAQNGVTSNTETDFLQFSHLTDIPTITSSPPLLTDTRDFHFGECQLMTGVGAPTVNNLFNMYWLPYYSELYNPDTRTMTIKVNLSPADINTFKFNDTVYIKNRVFRVNKIDYKPNDLATVEFILIP